MGMLDGFDDKAKGIVSSGGGGFNIPAITPRVLSKEPQKLRQTLVRLDKNLVVHELEAPITAVDMSGNIIGTDLRLNTESWADLMHIAQVPQTFLERLAKVNEQAAYDLLVASLQAFHAPALDSYRMLVDVSTSTVVGFVPSGAQRLKLSELFDLLTSVATPTVGEVRLEGTTLSLSVCDYEAEISAAGVGDTVSFGYRLKCAYGMASLLKLQEYHHRKVSMSGSVRDIGQGGVISLTQDVDVRDLLIGYVAEAQKNIPVTLQHMQAAPTVKLDSGPAISAVRKHLMDSKFGGSAKFEAEVTKVAVHQAALSGRDETELTVWDFFNGQTIQAMTAPLAKAEAIQANATNFLFKFVRFGDAK